MKMRHWFSLPIRRRRWLISAQGWSANDNPGSITNNVVKTLKGFGGWRALSGFNTISILNPGLKVANAFGVFSNRTITDDPHA